ncbi:MAG: hypothetical protein LBU86_01560 [Oscillospiraceae bacterium]|jgi:hypothetical protein|nr:hypothetical protein [Oscillospiraceae bacterium]
MGYAFYCKAAALAIAAAMLLCGCRERSSDSSSSAPAGGELSSETASASSPPPAEASPAAEESAPLSPEGGEGAPNAYIAGVAAEVTARITTPGMTEFERAKAAFDYIVETTTLADPVGLELWRVRGGEGDSLPTFAENRSLSVLLYNIGMCEDYAAALTVLLRAMGLEAEYLPGLTWSTEGFLVDHSWTVAKIDGVWYHLDTQLEDNVSRHGAINYRYFMRGDSTLSASHRWGQNLIDSGLLTEGQNGEIKAGFIPPACPRDYETPARRRLASAHPPDTAAIRAAVEAEIREYEEKNGPLAPMELNTIPPLFGLAGYGPED